MQINLNRIATFLKNEVVLISLAVIVLIMITASTYALIKAGPAYKGVRWNNVTPGKTTVSQLEKSLGKPKNVTTENNGQTLNYEKSGDKRPIAIFTQDDTAQIIKEPVTANERGNLSDYIQKLGQPEKILYGNHGIAAPGYFWGSKGLLVFGNPASGIIVEIWYFPPTTLQEFMSKNPSLSENPPKGF